MERADIPTLADRYRENRVSGLSDHRLRPSPRHAPVAEIARMPRPYRDLYSGFTVKHFHAPLGQRHHDTVTKLHLKRTARQVPRIPPTLTIGQDRRGQIGRAECLIPFATRR